MALSKILSPVTLWNEFIQLLSGTHKFEDRYHSLEIKIENGMKGHSLTFKDEYFSSGGSYSHVRTTIEPNKSALARVANGKGCPTGVCGGMAFSIDGTEEFLIIGFTNPILGCMKSYIEVNREGKAKTGYDKCGDDAKKVDEDHDKFILEAMFHMSEKASRKIVYIIREKP